MPRIRFDARDDEARAIVAQLANGPPTHDARGPLVCGFCDETMDRGRDSRAVEQHADDCLYRRAAELVYEEQ